MSKEWAELVPDVLASQMLRDTSGSKYAPTRMAKILDLIANGKTVKQACAQNGVTKFAYYRWRNENSNVMKATLLAMEIGEDTILDECLEIADNQEEEPESRRVRVWARLQILEKRNPERYGNKIKVTHDMQPVLEQLNAARARVIEHKG